MRELPLALLPFAPYHQFVIYLVQPSRARPGKTDKFPCDWKTGRVVNAHDPQYWTDAPTAIVACEHFIATTGQNYGVGFVVSDSDPFWFLDMDNCQVVDPETKNVDWSPVAKQLCQVFNGAALEVSQSGMGLHLFGVGRPPAHGCKNETFGLEFYHSGRLAALTGTHASGSAAVDFTAALPWLVANYFPATSGPGFDPSLDLMQQWALACTEGPAEEWRGPADDEELIRRALQSRSTGAAFGDKASFADLWTCNIPVLAKAYPDDVRAYDSNRADSALAQHLSFWTGRDHERIARLMPRSALNRDKFERPDYLPRTIMAVCARNMDVLTDKLPEPLAGSVAGPLPSAGGHQPVQPTLVTGSIYLGIEDQFKLFVGCVYVRDIHRVLVPGGLLLKPDQFKVNYGGYVFQMDTSNEKTTRDAWEAFTQSNAYRCPRADSSCFKPDLPAGALIERGGQVFTNTYWPVEVPRKVGDPTPFLIHLQKVLPDERDRLILLSYMAACVQHKGYKFQWAPLLQGVEGNGKTLFTRCVAEAVGRRYVHWPKASKICKEFNAWMIGKLFYGVEDIYVPEQKREIIEELKPMITGGDGLEIEGKGVDQISADICGNFIFNSNHKDAVRKTKNDRRYGVMFSAQQQAEDLARDGMGGDYFPKLYDWLRADGYAIVSELLHTFPIPPEYNPATLCQIAPKTTSTQMAIDASQGGVEQEIAEAVAQGLPGFCGGWLSSMMLDALLERMGSARRLTHSKRREMLDALGYVAHPALPDGRVNNLVLPDNGKPRLFILKTAVDYRIATPADAARAYETANNSGRVAFPFAAAR
jgi:hypothetical protein